MKPLGAGLYWKPVALTKNPTVLVCCAFVAAVKLVITCTVRQLTPRWCLHENCHTLSIHPGAPCGNILLETRSFNCRSVWSCSKTCPQKHLCIMGVWIVIAAILWQFRKKICFKVQVLINKCCLLRYERESCYMKSLQLLWLSWKWEGTSSWGSHCPAIVSLQSPSHHRHRTTLQQKLQNCSLWTVYQYYSSFLLGW